MKAANDNDAPEVTLEELEQFLDHIAYLIDADKENGDAYLPLFERLESELEAMKNHSDKMSRVRARLKRLPGQMAA